MQAKITVKKWVQRKRTRWVVRFHEHGAIKHRFFASRAGAESEASRLRTEASTAGTVWNSLTAAERERVIASWRESQQPKQSTAGNAVTLEACITELITAKRKAGRAEDYLDSLEMILGWFKVGREMAGIESVTHKDVEAFLDSKSLDSRSTLRSRLSTLFKFAIRLGYRSDNPCDKLEAVTVAKKPIQVLTVEQVKRCLEALSRPPRTEVFTGLRKHGKRKLPYRLEVVIDYRHGLPWFILSTFCGMRPEEAEKTTRDCINLDEGWVRIEAQTSKVRQRRVIYPKACALKLLSSVLDVGGLPLAPQSRRRVIRHLRGAVGFKVWPKDITRHSAASYWLASGDSETGVAEALGNSVDVLRKHYKALVTRIEAEKFWRLAESSAINRSIASLSSGQ